MSDIAVFWFRRDLRLTDNTGLFYALSENPKVLPIFIFDTEILSELPKDDARLNFIFDSLEQLKDTLRKNHRGISTYYGTPLSIFKQILKAYNVTKVYTNHDYEPYALKRDAQIAELLNKQGVTFTTYKDQVFFEKNEIVKLDGSPYKVYTPYKNKWKEIFRATDFIQYSSENYLNNIIEQANYKSTTLEDLGFKTTTIRVIPYKTSPDLIQGYEDTRNYPSNEEGTSKLGPHLRFGTVSVREIIKKAIAQKNEIFWSELIWREFFMQILWHFPHTQNSCFKPKYDHIEWRNNEMEFEKWKNGKTGYPLVDAGMRELNTTGYMHNRIRMLVGSFLCKHLLIDWRWGEAYFAEKLLDYELSSNIGNWQWVAGTGVDASPYFRIFNPTTQIQKFDKEHTYIKRWIKDLNKMTYPAPMVDHKLARERCLSTYKRALD